MGRLKALCPLAPSLAVAVMACSAPSGSTGLLPPVESSPLSRPAPARAPTIQEVPRTVREALARLGAQSVRCDVFDYFPRGGMRSFYCHLRPLLSYQTARKLSGVQVFLKGPHTAQGLVFSSPDFGHYNPEFVGWLQKVARAIAGNPKLLRATRPVYRKNVRYLARNLMGTYVKLKNNPRYLRREIKSKRWATDYERYFFFMNPRYIENPSRSGSYYWRSGGDGDGFDGNVVKTCVAFWIRRSVDGTAGTFHGALRTLMCAYDRALVYKLGDRCPGPL